MKGVYTSSSKSCKYYRDNLKYGGLDKLKEACLNLTEFKVHTVFPWLKATPLIVGGATINLKKIR